MSASVCVSFTPAQCEGSAHRPGSRTRWHFFIPRCLARLCAKRRRHGNKPVPSRASQSDGQGSHEDKLLEAIYPDPVVSDTGE